MFKMTTVLKPKGCRALFEVHPQRYPQILWITLQAVPVEVFQLRNEGEACPTDPVFARQLTPEDLGNLPVPPSLATPFKPLIEASSILDIHPRMSNVECRMTNGEWRMANGECWVSGVSVGSRRLQNQEARRADNNVDANFRMASINAQSIVTHLTDSSDRSTTDSLSRR